MSASATYFYRLREVSDEIITEFCVRGHSDPRQFVETLAPDGTPQRWENREEGDLLVFHAPDGYSGQQGLIWSYDNRLQEAVPMPRAELEKEAMRMRVSAIFPGLPFTDRPIGADDGSTLRL